MLEKKKEIIIRKDGNFGERKIISISKIKILIREIKFLKKKV